MLPLCSPPNLYLFLSGVFPAEQFVFSTLSRKEGGLPLLKTAPKLDTNLSKSTGGGCRFR